MSEKKKEDNSQENKQLSTIDLTGVKDLLVVAGLVFDEKKCLTSTPFAVNGKGTFIFNVNLANEKSFFISVEDEDGKNSLALYFDSTSAYFFQDWASNFKLLERAPGTINVEKGQVSHWYSYDRDNMVLKYGKGYIMNETTILVQDFLKGKTPEDQEKLREQMKPYFNPENQKHVRQYKLSVLSSVTPVTRKIVEFIQKVGGLDKKYCIKDGGLAGTVEKMQFDENPFICNLPPMILDSSKSNLLQLDRGEYILSASLPVACRELYENIQNCELDESKDSVSGLKLSDCIRYSITAEGCILNKKLKEKSNNDLIKKNTYLRITLGKSYSQSPGIPYVLEIWPSGHQSPIHNHGNANAVIKVLFGTIHVRVYNKHTYDCDDNDDAVKCLKEMDLNKGDITWINRNWYQTHKLKNVSSDFCATIQCYKYDSGDKTHWPYFDYISENRTIGEFLPNSDFTFESMCTQVMEEYKEYKRKKPWYSKVYHSVVDRILSFLDNVTL